MKNNNPRFNDETIIAALPDHLTCDLSGDAAILKISDGIYYGLNETAAFLWERMQKPIRSTSRGNAGRFRCSIRTSLPRYVCTSGADAECKTDRSTRCNGYVIGGPSQGSKNSFASKPFWSSFLFVSVFGFSLFEESSGLPSDI